MKIEYRPISDHPKKYSFSPGMETKSYGPKPKLKAQERKLKKKAEAYMESWK